MKRTLLALLSVPLGILAGCTHADRQATSSSHASAATQPSAAHAANPPATAPAVPDPRETQYLTAVTQLTSGFDKAGEGYFSADMKWIIFQASPEGETQYQMYVAPLEMGDGSSPKIGAPIRISPPNSRNTCGFFSPDGKTVIFGSTAGKEKAEEPNAGYQRQGGNYRWAFPDGMEIYAAPLTKVSSFGWHFDTQLSGDYPFAADVCVGEVISSTQLMAGAGAIPQRPSAPPATMSPPNSVAVAFYANDHGSVQQAGAVIDLAKPENRLTNNDAYDAEGSFSPDGKWICFTSRRSGDTEIWVMKADGSSPVQITKNPGYDGGPFFAPDGKRLLYRSDRKQNDLLQVFVGELSFDAAGNITGLKSEKQLTDDANVNWGPYFHPDNKHIIYATSAHGHHNYELYLMRDDGSHKTRITYCAGFDGLPVFSPDGKYLMWSSKRTKDNTTQLFIAKFQMPKAE